MEFSLTVAVVLVLAVIALTLIPKGSQKASEALMVLRNEKPVRVWTCPEEPLTPSRVAAEINSLLDPCESLDNEERVKGLLWGLQHTRGVSVEVVARAIRKMNEKYSRILTPEEWTALGETHRDDPAWIRSLLDSSDLQRFSVGEMASNHLAPFLKKKRN